MDELSMFDKFGGHYSAGFDGIEFCKFAPSSHWTEYSKAMENVPGFYYKWISNG